jgi:hypothetical protein
MRIVPKVGSLIPDRKVSPDSNATRSKGTLIRKEESTFLYPSKMVYKFLNGEKGLSWYLFICTIGVGLDVFWLGYLGRSQVLN